MGKENFMGRRLEDRELGNEHLNPEIGDYWLVLDHDGTRLKANHPENLTGTCWYVTVPLHGKPQTGFLRLHTVRQEDDGSISVRPNDGSSNSILVKQKYAGVEDEWHGYVERGYFRSV